MRIRSATEQDSGRVIDLAKAMHAESRFSVYELQESKLEELFYQILSEPRWRCLFLAESSSSVVVGMLGGYVLPLFFAAPFIAQDQIYFVESKFRGSSAAVKLLLAFERWAKNRQVVEININMSVGIDIERFDRFMAHAGYRSCGKNFFKSMKTGTGQHVV